MVIFSRKLPSFVSLFNNKYNQNKKRSYYFIQLASDQLVHPLILFEKNTYSKILLRLLTAPVHPPHLNLDKFIWILIFGLACSVFIMVFNLFGIADYAHLFKIKAIIISHGLVYSFSIILMEAAFQRYYLSSVTRWTITKSVAWYFLVFVVASFINFLFKSYWNGFIDFTLIEFFNVMYATALISIPVGLFVFGMFKIFNRSVISNVIEQGDFVLKIEDDQNRALNINDILYLSSNDNYVIIHFKENNKKQKAIVRSTLKKLEDQVIYAFSPIIRCHRKYLINKNHFRIEKATSRSMILSLKDYKDSVNVSSQYIESVKRHLN